MENRKQIFASKDEVIAKLKDDGDFDRLRLKIIRTLKDNEELRNNVISVVKQSAALNRAGAEKMKPRQLSDAIYEEVGSEVMSLMSEGVWKIIKAEDGMKSEIADTVQSVYNKLVNPGGIRLGESSIPDALAVRKGTEKNFPMNISAGEFDDIVSDYEPKEPPGFALPHNHDDDNHEKPPKQGLQAPVPVPVPVPCDEEFIAESKERTLGSQYVPEPPGFSKDKLTQPYDGSDEDPDVPPGFGC